MPNTTQSAETPPIPRIGGFREAVISVRDLDRYSQFFAEVGGWQIQHRGDTDPRLIAALGLPATVTASEVLMAPPAESSGLVRLIRFDGVEQQIIRGNDQSWDTGGLFDLNARVRDLDATAAVLQRHGWRGMADPALFKFGPMQVREWLARGPEGVCLALIQRIDPPLEGWELPESGFSRLFNSSQIVRDMTAALRFYRDGLGFTAFMESVDSQDQPGPNILGLPHNLADTERRIVMLTADEQRLGTVELLSFGALRGADFSALAVPPNLGMLSLRFPVLGDARRLATRLAERGLTPVVPPVTVELPPYGECELFSLRTPEGAWLDFFSVR